MSETKYFRSRGSTLRGRVLVFSSWTILNVSAFFLSGRFQEEAVLIVVPLVVILSPFFVEAVHVWDKQVHKFGLRCMRQAVPTLPSSDFRRSVRLQMLAITSGFAATLFILSVQLYLELGPQRLSFTLIKVMALLFFLASVLNLLQILLHDFKLSCDLSNLPKLKDDIDGKLEFFMILSWHSLVSPVVLAFALLDLQLCVLVNLLYGYLLFY
jgi:hypothetical protein